MRLRIVSVKEQKELRLITHLQALNIYPQLVRRLTEGDSARSVAIWARTQKLDGSPGAWSLSYWLEHMWALAKQVREAKVKLDREEWRERGALAPVPRPLEAVRAKMEEIEEEKSILDKAPRETAEILKHVMGENKNLESIHLLQIAGLGAVTRVMKLERLDRSMPTIMIPNGHKDIENLRRCGESLLKHEIAMGWVRGRKGQVPVSLPENSEFADIAKSMQEFDEVDRSLARELSVRFIDMIQEKAGGQFRARSEQLENNAGDRESDDGPCS